MSAANIFALVVLFSNAILLAFAYDPDPLQDLCVAFPSSGVKVNGYACKDEANVMAEDFFFDGLAKPGVIQKNNTLGSVGQIATVDQIPGLNTLGLSLVRLDYRVGGLSAPHIHPRATEIVFVVQGELLLGFITTLNKHIFKVIKTGEVFVFPKGLLHYQKNVGNTSATLISAFNSQNPGALIVKSALFAATPTVDDNVLAQTFQITIEEVHKIKNPPQSL